MEDQQPTDTGTSQARIAALETELAACRREMDTLRTNASIAETLLANIPPVIERFDRQLRHIYISPALERLTGHAPEADLGKTSRELGAPEDMAAAFETALRSVFATGRPVEIEYDYAPINQAPRCHRGHFVPEFGSDGTVQTVLAIEHDITEHKRSYEQIATLTQYQQAIIDNAEVYISAMDTQRNVLIWNAAAERITGYSRAEVLGNNRIYDWLYPDPAVHQAVLDTVAELLDERHSGEVAFLRRMCSRRGDLRTLSFHSRRLRDAQGRAIGYVNVGVDITDHLEALEALADERNLLRTLIDHLPDAVFLKDVAGRYVICNLAFAHLQGFGMPQDMVGLTTFDTDPPELAQRYHADDVQVMQTGRPWIDREEPVVDADGATRWFSTTKVPRRDAAGNVVGLIGISHDITGRREAAEQREDRLRFEELLATISAGFVDVAGGQFDVRVRQGLQRLGEYLGVDRASLLEVTPDQPLTVITSWAAPGFEPLPPQSDLAQYPSVVQVMRRGETVNVSSLDDVPADWPVDRQALAEAGVQALLAIPLRAGDTLMGILTCACLGRPHDWPEALVQRVHLVGQVFAGALAHARADRALHISEERHRRFFENAVLGMFRHSVDGRPIHVNAAYARMFGYESPQAVLATVRSVGADLYADPSRRPAIVHHLLHAEEVLATEVQYRRRDGSLFTAVLHAWSVRDETGQVQYFEGYLEDITQRKAAEDALRQSEQRFRTMADFTYDWEHWIAPDGRIIYMSPACERITGYRREDYIADPDLLNRIIHPDDRAAYTDHVQAAESRRQVNQIEMRVITRRGEERWIGHACQPVYGEDGTWLGWRTSNRDITDRKQAEADQARLQAQLLQAQKMEAIGRLTAGIAHDFNNLLTVINGFAELLKMHLPPEADASGYVDKIITAGQRAAGLVSKLMAFGRKQMLQPRVVDLNEILAGMGALLHRLIGEDITLQVQLADGLWPVKVDPTQIEQVIINLAVNARDAMPTGGWLTITSDNATLTGERMIGLDTQPAGDYVHLTISDSGSGMSEEVKAHLFEPFFTTKPLGQGTGLGLATVYGIVRQSGGYVEVSSAEGQGTCFDIYLPRALEEVPSPPPSRRGTAPLTPSGAETILVVEDDAGVRRLAAHVLRDRGYHVLEAADAATALRLAGEFDGAIHLLLSDVVMPGASGKDLAVQLSAPRPGLRVVLMSGYSGDMIADRGSLPPGIEFVQKPISAGELARTVRQVLDRE